jgi:hypothetical protein
MQYFQTPSQPEAATPIVTKLTVTSRDSFYLTGKTINSNGSGNGMQVAHYEIGEFRAMDPRLSNPLWNQQPSLAGEFPYEAPAIKQ